MFLSRFQPPSAFRGLGLAPRCSASLSSPFPEPEFSLEFGDILEISDFRPRVQNGITIASFTEDDEDTCKKKSDSRDEGNVGLSA